MKRIISVVLIAILCFSLVGCAKTYHGTDELMEKARQEIPISDADTIEMQYAGMCGEDNRKIVWYISGDEYQAHYYLPMEIEVKGNSEDYTFVHTYKPITDKCADVAIVNWHQGYAFLINNIEVSRIQMTLEDEEVVEEVIQKDTIPYTFYVPFIPSEYVFLDEKGNEIE